MPLNVWTGPDGRHRLYGDEPGDEEFAATAAGIAADLGGRSYVTVDVAEQGRLAALAHAGFVESRREHRFRIPVRPFVAACPDPVVLRSAADVSPLRLLALDVAIRNTIPGADGWTADPLWFQRQTFESPDFDPATYLVACDGIEQVGLARVWMGERPRLGCVGVVEAYQRRGIAAALLSRIFDVLAGRGVTEIVSEVDTTNAASLALHRRLAAEVTGTDVEMCLTR